jgi:hypothetical protein
VNTFGYLLRQRMRPRVATIPWKRSSIPYNRFSPTGVYKFHSLSGIRWGGCRMVFPQRVYAADVPDPTSIVVAYRYSGLKS